MPVKSNAGSAGKHRSPELGARLGVTGRRPIAIEVRSDRPIEMVALYVVDGPYAMLQHLRPVPEHVVVVLLTAGTVVLGDVAEVESRVCQRYPDLWIGPVLE